MGGEPKTAAEWMAARAAHANMDGSAWDAEDERLDGLWEQQYRSAFVEVAMNRPGWKRDNAEEWAACDAGNAREAYRGDARSPAELAAEDVLEAEREQ